MMLDISKPQILLAWMIQNLPSITAYSDIPNAMHWRNVAGSCILYELIIEGQYLLRGYCY